MYVCPCYFLQDILPNTPSTGVEAVGIERQKYRFISTKLHGKQLIGTNDS